VKGSTTTRDQLAFYWDDPSGVDLGSTKASKSGKFHGKLVVPATTNGSHTVIADDIQSDCETTASYSVDATLVLSSKGGSPGANVTARMTGFGGTQPVTLILTGQQVATAFTDSNGSATVSFAVPTVPKGRYEVSASGSGGPVANAKFRVSG
jgi:hypothetical protein